MYKKLEQGGIMRLHYEGILEERLDELGEMPLPPYIKERLDDPDRYQTVYAKENGSAAAAGLHLQMSFTENKRQRCQYCIYYTTCWPRYL